MIWKCLLFDDLSLRELYQVLHLRQVVFVVEQNCPYLDTDFKDLSAWHLLGFDTEGGDLLAYARLLPPKISYPDAASIGRVVASPTVRGAGVGKALMEQALNQMAARFPHCPIHISAQCYLQRFYESFGFCPVGEPYLEDDIPHIKMKQEF